MQGHGGDAVGTGVDTPRERIGKRVDQCQLPGKFNGLYQLVDGESVGEGRNGVVKAGWMLQAFAAGCGVGRRQCAHRAVRVAQTRQIGIARLAPDPGMVECAA